MQLAILGFALFPTLSDGIRRSSNVAPSIAANETKNDSFEKLADQSRDMIADVDERVQKVYDQQRDLAEAKAEIESLLKKYPDNNQDRGNSVNPIQNFNGRKPEAPIIFVTGQYKGFPSYLQDLIDVAALEEQIGWGTSERVIYRTRTQVEAERRKIKLIENQKSAKALLEKYGSAENLKKAVEESEAQLARRKELFDRIQDSDNDDPTAIEKRRDHILDLKKKALELTSMKNALEVITKKDSAIKENIETTTNQAENER